jgi:hypothetical protein
MAKANKYHSAGHTFRRTSQVKIPLEDRIHNKDKWKMRGDVRKETKQKSGWWKKKGEKEDVA